MDPLSQILMQRAAMNPIQPEAQAPQAPQAQAEPPAPTPTLPVVPPNPQTKVPQAVKRFSNAQAIMDAYRQGWSPNPVLLRATLGHK